MKHSLAGWYRRHVTAMVLLVLGGIAGVTLPQSAQARFQACRKDPIVWLSNGKSVQMTVDIYTAAANVRTITYTLHAPAGTTVQKIVYTGGKLSSKEEAVIFLADQPGNHYTTETLVTTRDPDIAVESRALVGGRRGSGNGVSGSPVIASVRLK